MSRRRGKGTLYLATVLAVVVVSGVGYTLRDFPIEQYYLWQLDSEDDEQRQLAAATLARIGSVRAAPRLIRILGASLEANQLTSLGESEWNATTSDHLSGRAFEDSIEYFSALRKIKATANRSIVSRFAEQLASADSPTRYLTILQIAEFAEHGKKAVPGLTQRLFDREPMIRHYAARVLGLIGRDARSAVPTLRRLLADTSPAVRLAAQRAIDSIERPATRS